MSPREGGGGKVDSEQEISKKGSKWRFWDKGEWREKANRLIVVNKSQITDGNNM